MTVSSEANTTRKERIRQKWVAMLGSAKSCTRFERSDRPGELSDTVSEWVSIACDPSLTDVVHNIGKHFNVCPTVVMATMYSLALQTFLQLKSREVIIGCAFANRRRSQQGMVGHTVSLLPMRINFSESPDLATLFAQVNEGWCLILEGGISLIDLLPSLPCLNTGHTSASSDTDPSTSSSRSVGDQGGASSPLQTVFSFLSTSQKSVPHTISLPDGTQVQCHVEHPRSCDAHVDLFLEVRSPKNWDGEGSESSYLLTWEYRVRSLSQNDITYLHNLMTTFLMTSLKCVQERGTHGVGVGLDYLVTSMADLPSRDNLIDSEIVANSYHYTQQLREKSASTTAREKTPSTTVASGETTKNALPGLWVWQMQQSTSRNTNTAATAPQLPTLVRPPRHASLIEGLALQKSRKLSYIEQFMMKAYEIPEDVAFRSGVQKFTYYDTAVMIDKLASVLLREGVEPGDHVGIVIPHSVMLYISLLATLRCGAAYVPLSLHNPAERIVDMLESADSKLLITDTETLRNRLETYRGQCVCVDSENLQNILAINDDIPALPHIDYQGQQVAYIIFTSGTTGKPKGVAITNDSLSHFVSNFLLIASPHDTEVTLAGCTVAWDGHILDSLGPLLNGACLVVTETLNISEGITYTFMSPSAASVLAFPQSMRLLLVGGEAFTQTCYENTKMVPKLLTVYGPTETTVFVSADHVTGPDVGRCLSNLGVPMPNVTLMVCDSNYQPVPLGTEGELCIAGPQVSRVGYYKNTEKTAAVFVKSPLPQYDIVYRTGDWTRMLPDGRVVYLGRTDDQVKLRGMRFQLLEVENTLRKHPQVKMAAAVVRNLGTPSAQLVVYATPKTVDVNSLFEFARANLPSYMVPSAIALLDTMPLRTEGKVDRVALINLGLPMSADTTDTIDTSDGTDTTDTCDMNINDQPTKEVPTLTHTADQLAAIFGQVLDQKTYPTTADFFTHGGQSLLLFRLLQLVKNKLKCNIQLVDLLQNPTPLSLAKIIVSSPDHLVTMAQHSRQKGNSDRVMGNVSNVGVDSEHQRDVEQSVTTSSVARESETEILNRSLEEEGLIKSMATCELTQTTTTLTTAKRSHTTTDDSLIDFDYLEPVPDTPLPEGLVESLHALWTRDNREKSGISAEGLSQQLLTESGYHIPPASLESYRNMETLKTHLKLKCLISFFEQANTPVIKLRPPNSSTDCPLIFVHGGIIGWPVSYLSLAKSFNESSIIIQRCKDAPTSSFEAMAAYYVEAILSAQPEGPYRLIGVCYGAMLIYEIARQLTDRGKTIQLAVFLNHSPAIEKCPVLFNSSGEPLPDTFAHPVVFFRKILGLPLAFKEEEGNVVGGGKREGVRVGGGDGVSMVEVGRREDGVLGESGKEANDGEEIGKTDINLERMVKSVAVQIKSSPESCWVPFTAGELERVYLGFFRRLRAAWMSYKPRPGANIQRCVLIRNRHHPLFDSIDYSLRGLLPDSSSLSVVTMPRKMGLLREPYTLEFVRTSITLHLK